jgi:hypothetical protein
MLKGQKTGSGVFIAAEFDGVGNQGSGDITMVDVESPLEAFLEVLRTSNFFFSCQIIKISRVSLLGLKKFCCRWFIVEKVLGWG